MLDGHLPANWDRFLEDFPVDVKGSATRKSNSICLNQVAEGQWGFRGVSQQQRFHLDLEYVIFVEGVIYKRFITRENPTEEDLLIMVINHFEPDGYPFANGCFNWMMNQIFT